MIRMLISLKEADKKWLMQQAKKEKISAAELVRQAILLYREKMQHKDTSNVQDLLQKTKGIWGKGDGLNYQEKIRKEWK